MKNRIKLQRLIQLIILRVLVRYDIIFVCFIKERAIVLLVKD
jgi:hypothetical protein